MAVAAAICKNRCGVRSGLSRRFRGGPSTLHVGPGWISVRRESGISILKVGGKYVLYTTSPVYGRGVQMWRREQSVKCSLGGMNLGRVATRGGYEKGSVVC